MRCPVHDLALGSDGRCVLCRRDTRPPASVPRSLFVAGGLALVVLFGIFLLKSRPPAPAPEPPAVSARPGKIPAALAPVAPEERPEPALAFAPPPVRVETALPAPGAPKAPATAAAPTADDMRAAMKEVPITMYSTNWCPHCVRARSWFRANSIAFVEHDVEASPAAKRAQRKLNPAGGVPTIDVDGAVLVGFSERNVGNAIAASVQRRIRSRQRRVRRCEQQR